MSFEQDLTAGQALRLQSAFADQQHANQMWRSATNVVRNEIAAILPERDTGKSQWRLDIDGDAVRLVEVAVDPDPGT